MVDCQCQSRNSPGLDDFGSRHLPTQCNLRCGKWQCRIKYQPHRYFKNKNKKNSSIPVAVMQITLTSTGICYHTSYFGRKGQVIQSTIGENSLRWGRCAVITKDGEGHRRRRWGRHTAGRGRRTALLITEDGEGLGGDGGGGRDRLLLFRI